MTFATVLTLGFLAFVLLGAVVGRLWTFAVPLVLAAAVIVLRAIAGPPESDHFGLGGVVFLALGYAALAEVPIAAGLALRRAAAAFRRRRAAAAENRSTVLP